MISRLDATPRRPSLPQQPPYGTLQQRRKAWMANKRRNLDLALAALSEYAKANDGKFYLFGSALDTATFALHSDVDLIADFGSSEKDWEAFMNAQEILAAYDLEIGGLPKTGCTPRFLSRISRNWRAL